MRAARTRMPYHYLYLRARPVQPCLWSNRGSIGIIKKNRHAKLHLAWIIHDATGKKNRTKKSRARYEPPAAAKRWPAATFLLSVLDFCTLIWFFLSWITDRPCNWKCISISRSTGSSLLPRIKILYDSLAAWIHLHARHEEPLVRTISFSASERV